MSDKPFSLSSFLMDPQGRRTLAIAAQNDNRLATEGAGQDVLEMSYNDLLQTYGPEVANQQYKFQLEQGRLRQSDRESRSGGERVGDTALDLGGGFVSGAGSLIGVPTAYALGAGVGLATGRDPLDNARATAANAALRTQSIAEGIGSFRSDLTQERLDLMGIKTALDEADNQADYEEAIEAGESPFLATTKRIGADVIDAAKNYGQDTTAASSLVANALGSMGPSSGVARLALSTIPKATAKTRAGRIAQTAVTSVAIGSSEASEGYTGAVSEVMSMDDKIINGSPVYQGLLLEGYTPEEARYQLAHATGWEAFKGQLPASIALGVIGGKFEAMPLATFADRGIVGALRTMTAQTIEEGGQGGVSQLNVNAAIRDNIDPERDIVAGIGTNIGTGAVAGAGMAATLGTVAAPVNAGRSLMRNREIAEENRQNRETDNLITPGLNEQAGRNVIDVDASGNPVSEATQPFTPDSGLNDSITDLLGEASGPSVFDQETEQTSKEEKSPIQTIIEKAGPLAQKVSETVRQASEAAVERMERPSSKEAEASTQAAVNTAAAVRESIEQSEINLPEVRALVEPDNEPVSEGFADVASNTRSPLDNMVGMIAKAGSRGVTLSDSDVSYAKTQIDRLKTSVDSLPKVAKREAMKVLRSPVTKSIEKRASKISPVSKPVPETVTPDTVAETVSVARSNPAESNPGTIKKILEQNNIPVDPKHIPGLRAASKISQAITRGRDLLIGVNKGNSPNSVPTTNQIDGPTEATIEGVSRSIVATGLKSPNGNLPSVNNYAGMFLTAAQSDSGSFVDDQGNTVRAEDTARRLGMFADHMINKVNALSESARTPGKKPGTGTAMGFDHLIRGERMAKAGTENNIKVTLHPGSSGSIKNARQAMVDANTTIEVYNALLEEFPESFPQGATPKQPVQLDESMIPEELRGETRRVVEEAAPQPNEPAQTENQTDNTTPPDDAGAEAGATANTETIEVDGIEITREEAEELRNSPDGVEEEDGSEASAEERRSEATTDDETSDDLSHDLDATVTPDLESILRDDKDQVIDFYHGTPSLFSEFSDNLENGIFFTTRKGQAREYARGGSANRIVRANIKSNNPLAIEVKSLRGLPDGSTPQDAWLARTEILKQQVEEGDHDALIIYSDNDTMKEAIVVVFRGNQVLIQDPIDETNREFTPEELETVGVTENDREESEQRSDAENRGVSGDGDGLQDGQDDGNEGSADRSGAETGEAGDAQGEERSEGDAGSESGTGDSRGVIRAAEDIGRRVSELFKSALPFKKGTPPLTGIEDLKAKAAADVGAVNPVLVTESESIFPFIRDAMNKRVQQVQKRFEKEGNPPRPLYVDGTVDEETLQWAMRRNLNVMDQETGQYDEGLLELATIAMVDWLATTPFTPSKKLRDKMENDNLTWEDFREDSIEDYYMGKDLSYVKDELGRKIMQMWNVEANTDAERTMSKGIAQALASEMLVVLNNWNFTADGDPTGVVNIKPVPLAGQKSDKGKAIILESLRLDTQSVKAIQERYRSQAKPGMHRTVGEWLFGSDVEGFSVGRKIGKVSQKGLSRKQRKAVQNMQDIPHRLDDERLGFFSTLGIDNLKYMVKTAMGNSFEDVDDSLTNLHLKASIEGVNMSIEQDLANAFGMTDQIPDRDVPVYYPVQVSSTGRHVVQGPSFQNNKWIRALVNPSRHNIDLSSETEQDSFWLAAYQGLDLGKVEKENHTEILRTVKSRIMVEFRDPLQIAVNYVQTGQMDSQAFRDAMGDTKVEPQALATLFEVARMIVAKKNGDASFETSLSAEMDGLTNGAANMMVAFGHGEMTPGEWMNLQRVGLFLGQTNMTVNEFFARNDDGTRNKDLYEDVAGKGKTDIRNRMQSKVVKPIEKAKLQAIANFASVFGDFSAGEMTRNSAKNPMTKVNYGSGVGGVATGIADGMLTKFYQEVRKRNITTQNLDEVFYPGIVQDMKLLGLRVPNNFQEGNFEFLEKSRDDFMFSVRQTVADVLTESTKQALGPNISTLNDTLVMTTSIQMKYLELLYDRKITEYTQDLADKGELRTNAQGKPIMEAMSEKQQREFLKDFRRQAPMMVGDEQTLDLGGFSRQKTGPTLGRSMNTKAWPKLSQPSLEERPTDVRVKILPYLIIGFGDGMMMNEIFSADNAPDDVMYIYDGIDIPAGKYKNYAGQINEAVLKTWKADVLGIAVNNWENFVNGAEDKDLIQSAFNILAQDEMNENRDVWIQTRDIVELSENLQEYRIQNIARKKVMFESGLAVSVDQMGGTNVGYTQDGETGITLSEFNRRVDLEETKLRDALPKKEDPVYITIREEQKPKGKTTAMYETDLKSMIRSLRMTGQQKKILDLVMSGLNPDTKVIVGSLDEMNQWRQENLPDDGEFLQAKGHYDARNGILFLTGTTPSTVLHELVHAGTFSRVLEHYEGKNPSEAVTRLETLMEEFLASDSKAKRVNQAKAAILEHQANAESDPFSAAAAVNEFMAWALTDQYVTKNLKRQEVSLKDMAKKVINLMRRIMGAIPENAFDHVVFNTKVLMSPDIEDGSGDNISGNGGDGDGNGGGNSDGSGIPPQDDPTSNYWTNLLREYLGNVQNDPLGSKELLNLGEVGKNAKKLMNNFRQVGLLGSQEAKNTFQSIYTLLQSQMKLDSQSVIALSKVFEHVEDKLTPEMFGTGPEADQIYQAVIGSFGEMRNADGLSDAIPVLMALSQTSTRFRNALDQIPEPEGTDSNDGTLRGYIGRASLVLMRKLTNEFNIEGENQKKIMDELAGLIIDHDIQEEYKALRQVTGNVRKGDKIVSNLFSQLAGWTSDRAQAAREDSDVSNLKKTLLGAAAMTTNLLDSDRSAITAQGAKTLVQQRTAWAEGFIAPVFVRELVTEFIGSDASNEAVIRLQDEVKYRVTGMRQMYRENLPKILKDMFAEPPTESQLSSIHVTLGQSDITRFMDLGNLQDGFSYLEDTAKRTTRIADLKSQIQNAYNKQNATNVLEKSDQLATYILDGSPGIVLAKNAYAINRAVLGTPIEAMEEVIDELVSLLVIDQMDSDVREETVQLWQNDPSTMAALVTYMQAANEAEDNKLERLENLTTEMTDEDGNQVRNYVNIAKMNGLKGYLPNDAKNQDTHIKILDDGDQIYWENRGYTRIGDYEGETENPLPRGYYVTSVPQAGVFSQGTMQTVAPTYRGVNPLTGTSVRGDADGAVYDGASITREMDAQNETNFVPTEDTMTPIFGSDEAIIGWERTIPKSIQNMHMPKSQDVTEMLGVWMGRNVEEDLSTQYNNVLIDRLVEIYEAREDDVGWVNLKTTDDKIYKDAYSLWPMDTKIYAESAFGDSGIWVKDDMINLVQGYREASVVDIWTGKTRMPEVMRLATLKVLEMVPGKSTMKRLRQGEDILQGTVSAAKEIIVVKSLVVPALNMGANVVQLTTNGVPQKRIIKGMRDKIGELNEFNRQRTRLMGLDNDLRLAARSPDQRRIIQNKIQVIEDQLSKMTIAPLVEAGQYKQLSEGITDFDVAFTSGRLAEYIESRVERLPENTRNIARLGIVSKSSELYQIANRATQYGDFLGKSIYYDWLLEEGMSPEEAMKRVGDEFVNYTTQPGRVRSKLESMGLTWFMSFKIRITQIALRQARENPVGALSTALLLPDMGSPIADNFAQVLLDGDRLDFVTGYEMLFAAPGLHPWVNLMSD